MSAQQPEIAQSQLQIDNSETTIYHLHKLFKILANYHHRNFINCFKWHVLQSLLKNMSNQHSKSQPPQKTWIYQSLLQKKNKTPQQMLELQFINMCASKIQNGFKAYIYQKRHRKAVTKLNKFKNVAKALVAGWKVRQIFRSVKIQESIKTIRVQRQQLARQYKVVQQTNNKYSMRKLEYLKNSLQDQVRKFSTKFQYLYTTGEWVFQPKVQRKRQVVSKSKWVKKQSIRNQKEEKVQVQIQQQLPKNDEKLQSTTTQEITKKKRVRQMRDRNPRSSKPQPKVQQKQQTSPQYPSNHQVQHIQYGNQISERPIKAKGVYKFDQLPNEILDEAPKVNKAQVKIQNKSETVPRTQETNDSEVLSKKNAEREKNKQKMQTRQKYDPRKAIQAEKKRKKQQEEQMKVGSETVIQQKRESKTIVQQDPSKSVQKVVQSKSQKVLKISQKEQISNRSTVNIGKGKSKVEAKIDCWGNRKTNKTNSTRSENNRMTYKMIHQPQQIEERNQQIQIKQIQNKGIALLNKIKEQKLIEKDKRTQRETRQQSYIQAIQQELRKNTSYQRNTPEAYVGQNRKLSTPLRQKMKRAQEMRQRQAHKQIQQLEKVYTEQYQSRFQRLLPKLHLLAAARQQESQGPIPVLMNNGSFMRKKISENLANNRFWMIGKKIENSFKQFDRTI